MLSFEILTSSADLPSFLPIPSATLSHEMSSSEPGPAHEPVSIVERILANHLQINPAHQGSTKLINVSSLVSSSLPSLPASLASELKVSLYPLSSSSRLSNPISTAILLFRTTKSSSSRLPAKAKREPSLSSKPPSPPGLRLTSPSPPPSCHSLEGCILDPAYHNVIADLMRQIGLEFVNSHSFSNFEGELTTLLSSRPSSSVPPSFLSGLKLRLLDLPPPLFNPKLVDRLPFPSTVLDESASVRPSCHSSRSSRVAELIEFPFFLTNQLQHLVHRLRTPRNLVIRLLPSTNRNCGGGSESLSELLEHRVSRRRELTFRDSPTLCPPF